MFVHGLGYPRKSFDGIKCIFPGLVIWNKTMHANKTHSLLRLWGCGYQADTYIIITCDYIFKVVPLLKDMTVLSVASQLASA